jgi:putative transposase
MSQSLARVWPHVVFCGLLWSLVVFSTKDRRAFLQHDAFRVEMCRMLGFNVNEIGCQALRAGGWNDHVHIVCGLSQTVTIAAQVEHVKVETSKWAKGKTHGSSRFS